MSVRQVRNTDEKAREVGRQQSLFRDVNERIKDLAASFEVADTIEIVCECGQEGCAEQFELPLVEYERLRLIPTHFAVLPGHEIPNVERIVEDHGRFMVVEKVGEGAVTAIRLDPRRRQL
jgi:hypothetical protein